MNDDGDRVLLVASETELLAGQRVWGTGGWMEPESREALDWLTLARLLGWGVRVTSPSGATLDIDSPGGLQLVVVACDPDALGEEFVSWLATLLAREPVLVIARAAAADIPLSRLAGVARRPERNAGQSIRWIGPRPDRVWQCRKPLEAAALELSANASVWATLDDAPLIVAQAVGRGILATMAFHPGHARDLDGTATALLQHLLICGSPRPVAWLDHSGTLVLRMDDPGGAQSVYSRTWCYPKLSALQCSTIATDLNRRDARLSIGYVAGWMDDGDVTRGTLEVDGQTPARVPGAVHPSPLVKYRDLAGHAPGTMYDYQAEYRGIQGLRAAGLADVELHGYTHMHPDGAAWATAPDRYESWPATAWYRELGRAAQPTIAARPPDRHPLALGMAALRRFFDTCPTSLICPGDQWTTEVLERALELGLQLVSSYYLAIRDRDRFCWCQHVCAPYLDQPDPVWFDAGLPVVGYFHDYEPARDGVGWIARWLDRWEVAGARRFVDLRELAAALGRRLHVEQRDGALRLAVNREAGAPALVRPLRLAVRLPESRACSTLAASVDERELTLAVEPHRDGFGRVVIPCA